MNEHVKPTTFNDKNITRCNEVFSSEDDMRQSLSRICYGDLYVIGRLWIEALKSGLTGSKINLIPVVHAAAKQPEIPQKPPKMSYKDLPIYTCPHYKYKDYLAQQEKCPEAKRKLIHEYLLPSVREYRIDAQKGLRNIRDGYIVAKDEIARDIENATNRIKTYFRDPDRLLLRQAVVLFGGLAGLRYTRHRGIPGRLFGTTLGAFFAGSLCFPRESDELFRNMFYYSGTLLIKIYNIYCSQNVSFRQRVPCADDVPDVPPVLPLQCPKKKT
ncbi:uncharacterized protein LOC126971454 [Leptidea sinapis]|uniref:uncharacterized protein LOC126971454 n=1 Tax=Leptidea sinapis TaxID=189913 RepID=UPI0021C4430D|nr:uncharacterized protein LOC126971454 [Leptidea sinapis]